MEEVTINILDMLAPSGVMHLLVKRLVSLLPGGLVGLEDKLLQLLLKLTRLKRVLYFLSDASLDYHLRLVGELYCRNFVLDCLLFLFSFLNYKNWFVHVLKLVQLNCSYFC